MRAHAHTGTHNLTVCLCPIRNLRHITYVYTYTPVITASRLIKSAPKKPDRTIKQLSVLNGLSFSHVTFTDSTCYVEILCQPYRLVRTPESHPTLPFRLPIPSLDVVPLDQRDARVLKVSSTLSQHAKPLPPLVFAAATAEWMTTSPRCYLPEETLHQPGCLSFQREMLFLRA